MLYRLSLFLRRAGCELSKVEVIKAQIVNKIWAEKLQKKE